MLSKKMTVSLMSLITIFALGFVAPSAMAQDFAVTLDTTGDISTAAGLQVRHPADNMLEVTLKSAEAIKLPAANIFVTTYDRLGNLVSIPGAEVDTEDASKEFVLTIEVTDAVTTVNIKINEGIASADPLSKKKSKKVNVNVQLLAVDDPDVAPRVYSIRRVDNPLIKATADTLQVIITLSEKPKSFKKAQVSVSNATHGDPVALKPVPENVVGLDQLESSLAATGILDPARPMPLDADGIRGVISRALTLSPLAADGAGTITDLTGLQSVRKVYEDGIAGEDASDLANLAALHIALDTALTALGGAGTAGNINYINDDGDLATVSVNNARQTAEVAADAVAELDPANLPAAMQMPTKEGTADIVEAAADPLPAVTIPAANFDRSKAADTYVPPNPADALADYNIQRAIYNALSDDADADPAQVQRTAYTEEKAIYDAYMAISDAIMEIEMDALAMWEQDELVPAAAQTSVPRIPGSNPLPSTGPDGMLHEFVVTITPKYPAGNPDIVVKVNEFANTDFPEAKLYVPPTDAADYIEGFDKLTIQTNRVKTPATTAGIEVVIGKGIIIPKDGYLVVAKSKAGSAVRDPGDAKKAPANPPRKPFGLTYNLVEGALPNLETLLLNGGTIDVVGPKQLVISEIMWGSDASIANSFESQYIELRNTSGAAITAGDKDYKLVLYTAGATLPDASVAANKIQDRAGTVGAHGRWTPLNKGQSGRTGVGEAPGDVVAITPTQELISMQRAADAASATGLAADGTDPLSWGASAPPGVNFDPNVEGERVGSPGRAPHTYPTAPTPTATTPTVPAATANEITITEIMVDTNNGRLPQWIELTYSGTAKASLDGWEMVIDNAIDADVLGGGNAITVSLSGAMVDVSAHAGNTGAGQSVLVAAWTAPRSSANIQASRVIILADQLNQKRQYQLLSYSGFRITLVPPRTGATIATFGDIAGNLHEDWEIPMSEDGSRSSLIRRETLKAGTATMGTDANGWVLASGTSLVVGQHSYYGDDEDAGTPGHDAGGPLPVELSHFRPARDKQTGAVVITWATQSELNNAGFFIKRSNQRNGQFQVINATMVPGAGTTSEKQFYTFTDTTAQPNVVYYYQIEDVSLDGNRQTLTRGIRLKGHIGAHGKLTSIWGELKSSNE